jgi:hypothetical protein
MARALSWVLLGLSIGLLTYQLFVRFSPKEGLREASSAEECPPAHSAEDVSATIPAHQAAGGCEAQAKACEQPLGRCREGVRECGGEVDAAQLPSVRFEKGEEDPETQARAGPELQRMTESTEGVDLSVECRSRICKVELVGPSAAISALRTAMRQDHWYRANVESGMFRAPTFTNDLVTGKPLDHHEMFLSIREEPLDAGGTEGSP